MIEALPIADVLWWDEKTVRIRCPFCKNSHSHGNQSASRYDFNNTRLAHCSPPLIASHMDWDDYRIRFPFDIASGGLAYEIDKEKKKFVTIGIQQDPEVKPLSAAAAVSIPRLDEDYDQDDQDDAGGDDCQPGNFDRGSLFRLNGKASREIVKMVYPDAVGQDDSIEFNSVNLAMSNCVLGDIDAVQDFLHASRETDIFVKGRDHLGKTMLSSVAAEMFPVMVSLLLEKGAYLNNQDHEGRTPLMEAALWGRFANVKILLNAGADKSIEDRAGYKAFQLAEPRRRNSEERSRRSVYKLDVASADQEREAIVRMLDTKPPTSNIRLSSPSPAILSHNSFTHVKEDSSILMTGPIAKFPVANEWKTIGWLERGPPFPSITAMSGWAHGSEAVVIGGDTFVADVFRVCKLIDHNLPSHRRDQGVEGRYNAAHAEKQLIAYFLSKHVFLGDKSHLINTNRQSQHSTALCENFVSDSNTRQQQDTPENAYEDTTEGDLRQLWLIRPLVPILEPDILVSTIICKDCDNFAAKVNKTFKLRLRIRHC